MATKKNDNNALPVSKDGALTVNPDCGSFLTIISVDQYEALKKEAADIDPGKSIVITATYKEFSTGEEAIGIFTGMDAITPNNTNPLTGEVEKTFCRSVQWMGQDGTLYQCAGVALVSQFWDEEDGRYIIPPGTKIKITHTGKSNRTKLYEVAICQ